MIAGVLDSLDHQTKKKGYFEIKLFLHSDIIGVMHPHLLHKWGVETWVQFLVFCKTLIEQITCLQKSGKNCSYFKLRRIGILRKPLFTRDKIE